MKNIDQDIAAHDQQDAEQQLKQANERAARAEQELLEIKSARGSVGLQRDIAVATDSDNGVQEMRKDSMMAHLLDSLDAKKDIGHYGRLVFAMVARHFLTNEAVLAWLQKDSDFSAEAAASMLRQVEGRDYNPPKRERLLEWQREQSFPILPNVNDPDCGNLYRNLKFPDNVYGHIQQYQEEKVAAANE